MGQDRRTRRWRLAFQQVVRRATTDVEEEVWQLCSTDQQEWTIRHLDEVLVRRQQQED
jgi:hypothetical protein